MRRLGLRTAAVERRMCTNGNSEVAEDGEWRHRVGCDRHLQRRGRRRGLGRRESMHPQRKFSTRIQDRNGLRGMSSPKGHRYFFWSRHGADAEGSAATSGFADTTEGRPITSRRRGRPLGGFVVTGLLLSAGASAITVHSEQTMDTTRIVSVPASFVCDKPLVPYRIARQGVADARESSSAAFGRRFFTASQRASQRVSEPSTRSKRGGQ
jgi:hypothetical protein